MEAYYSLSSTSLPEWLSEPIGFVLLFLLLLFAVDVYHVPLKAVFTAFVTLATFCFCLAGPQATLCFGALSSIGAALYFDEVTTTLTTIHKAMLNFFLTLLLTFISLIIPTITFLAPLFAAVLIPFNVIIEVLLQFLNAVTVVVLCFFKVLGAGFYLFALMLTTVLLLLSPFWTLYWFYGPLGPILLHFLCLIEVTFLYCGPVEAIVLTTVGLTAMAWWLNANLAADNPGYKNVLGKIRVKPPQLVKSVSDSESSTLMAIKQDQSKTRGPWKTGHYFPKNIIGTSVLPSEPAGFAVLFFMILFAIDFYIGGEEAVVPAFLALGAACKCLFGTWAALIFAFSCSLGAGLCFSGAITAAVTCLLQGVFKVVSAMSTTYLAFQDLLVPVVLFFIPRFAAFLLPIGLLKVGLHFFGPMGGTVLSFAGLLFSTYYLFGELLTSIILLMSPFWTLYYFYGVIGPVILYFLCLIQVTLLYCGPVEAAGLTCLGVITSAWWFYGGQAALCVTCYALLLGSFCFGGLPMTIAVYCLMLCWDLLHF